MRLLTLTTLIALSPACVLAVNVRGNHLRDEEPREEVTADTADAALNVSVTLDLQELTAGAVTILTATFAGEANGHDVVSLRFTGGVTVQSWRVLDSGDLLIAVEAAPESLGAIDLSLDFGDRGQALFTAILSVVADDTGRPPGP